MLTEQRHKGTLARPRCSCEMSDPPSEGRPSTSWAPDQASFLHGLGPPVAACPLAVATQANPASGTAGTFWGSLSLEDAAQPS